MEGAILTVCIVAAAAVCAPPFTVRSDWTTTLQKQAITQESRTSSSDVYWFYSLAAMGGMLCCSFLVIAPSLPRDPSCRVIESLMSSLWADKKQTIERAYTCMNIYKQAHHSYLIAGYILFYTICQAFAIPGPPLLLTILAGAFYPIPIAVLLAGGSAAVGSTVCFCVSQVYGKGVLAFLVKAEAIEDFKARLRNAATTWDMVQFMLLSRVTPIPNVLINLASPLLGVPMYIFIPTTFIGQIPLNIVHVTTGFALSQAGSYEPDPKTSGMIAGFGTLVAIASLVRYRYGKRTAQI